MRSVDDLRRAGDRRAGRQHLAAGGRSSGEVGGQSRGRACLCHRRGVTMLDNAEKEGGAIGAVMKLAPVLGLAYPRLHGPNTSPSSQTASPWSDPARRGGAGQRGCGRRSPGAQGRLGSAAAVIRMLVQTSLTRSRGIRLWNGEDAAEQAKSSRRSSMSDAQLEAAHGVRFAETPARSPLDCPTAPQRQYLLRRSTTPRVRHAQRRALPWSGHARSC